MLVAKKAAASPAVTRVRKLAAPRPLMKPPPPPPMPSAPPSERCRSTTPINESASMMWIMRMTVAMPGLFDQMPQTIGNAAASTPGFCFAPQLLRSLHRGRRLTREGIGVGVGGGGRLVGIVAFRLGLRRRSFGLWCRSRLGLGLLVRALIFVHRWFLCRLTLARRHSLGVRS